MEGNDLSNDLPFRLAFMWEGVLVERPEVHRFSRPKKIVSRATLRPNAYLRLWDLVWRWEYGIDLMTLMGKEYKDPLEHWVEEHNLPLRNVLAFDDVHEALTYLTANQFIRRVFIPHDASPFMFGSRGKMVPEHGDWEPLW